MRGRPLQTIPTSFIYVAPSPTSFQPLPRFIPTTLGLDHCITHRWPFAAQVQAHSGSFPKDGRLDECGNLVLVLVVLVLSETRLQFHRWDLDEQGLMTERAAWVVRVFLFFSMVIPRACERGLSGRFS